MIGRYEAIAIGVIGGAAVWMLANKKISLGSLGGELAAADGAGFSFMRVGYSGGVQLKLDKNFESLRWQNIRALKPDMEKVRYLKNVVAFLHVIRHKEHLAHIAHTTAAYGVMCGGGTFTDFKDHPRPVLKYPCGRGASGAYQITEKSWDGVVAEVGLKDFKPVNQERAAIYLMAYRGALQDVIDGRVSEAVQKLRSEWTSLPGAGEDRGYTMAEVKDVFTRYGGTLAAGE